MSSSKRSKIRFANQTQQSRMVAGVCVPILDDGSGDYDELLREAIRVALRMDTNPTHDDWHDLYDRIRALMDAYIASPEGRGENASTLCRASRPASPMSSRWRSGAAFAARAH